MAQSFSHSSESLDQPTSFEYSIDHYNPLKDRVYVTGLILLAISFGLFAVAPAAFPESEMFGWFMLHYLLVWIYMIVLWLDKRLRWWMFGARRAEYPTMLLLLLLWLVSCFALNREVTLFQPSVPWLTWHLALSGIACVAFAWHERMAAPVRCALWFILGTSLVLFIYYALALLPISMYGMIVVWFFGLPLHALIPLVLSVYLLLILRNVVKESVTRERLAVFAGVGLPLAIVAVFAGAWFQVSNQVVTHLKGHQQAPNSELPRWVTVSQHLDRNWLNGHLLKAVAEGNMPSRGGLFDDSWFSTFGARENDPLLQIAATVSPKPDLKADECRKIYASQYDSRNVMEEQLWSGHDLVTTSVTSRVMLDPGHRLSYTEKVLIVAHKTVGNSGVTATQEAIYTFFLPEGGVVTSLSLWIEGREEPGILTARSKAKEAYNTIVGRERRDPAVVFWQEGDQVRVRVFPVTREMPRQFKIGVTAPLHLDNQILVYENITFDGPSALLATERDSVFFEGNGVFADVPLFFKNENAGRTLAFDGTYRHKWMVACNAPPLSRSVFSFDGKTYVVFPWRDHIESFQPAHVYLDLNAAWTADELAAVRTLARDRSVYVAGANGFEQMTEQNATRLIRTARELRFSLFPYHKIAVPQESLVVTKSADPTPLPSELEGSIFGDELQKWAGGPVRVFHLDDGDRMSAYLRSLRERRDVFCISGNIELFKKYLESNSYPKNLEDSNTVALPESDVLIIEKDTVLNGKAPDHLFRLFAYNTVLRELRGRAKEEPGDLVRLAEQAYIVTPVTSLVTLESKADYERFDIKKTEGLNSLGNAASSGAGAVPEPHEWALLVLLTLGGWLAWRKAGGVAV